MRGSSRLLFQLETRGKQTEGGEVEGDAREKIHGYCILEERLAWSQRPLLRLLEAGDGSTQQSLWPYHCAATRLPQALHTHQFMPRNSCQGKEGTWTLRLRGDLRGHPIQDRYQRDHATLLGCSQEQGTYYLSSRHFP